MYPFAALIFLVIPVVEIYFLIQVGEQIGALWTVILVVLTAIIGVRLLKQQGLSTMMKAQQKMQTGALPATEMVEGIALLIAGAFLLTPGFFTDFIGFLLLIPVTRKAVVALFAAKAVQYFSSNLNSNINQSGANPFNQQQPPSQPSNDNVIEGVKYHKEDD
jgi:UPF0716 protein FxsA